VQVVFADILKSYEVPEEHGGIKLSDDDMMSFLQQRAKEEYTAWQERLVAQRGNKWPEGDIAQFMGWVKENHSLLLSGVERSREEGTEGESNGEYDDLRMKLVEAVMFPLLRPEFQGLPYLTRTVTEVFSHTAHKEAHGGVLVGLLKGFKSGHSRKHDVSSLEATVNDVLPKLVVKVYATVSVEKPFTWHLLGHVLMDRTRSTPLSAFKNLPDMRGLEGKGEVADYVRGKWQNLTKRLTMLALEEETASLGEDILNAYQSLNELHRIAEEILHHSGEAVHSVDEQVAAVKELHHGWIDEVGSKGTSDSPQQQQQQQQ